MRRVVEEGADLCLGTLRGSPPHTGNHPFSLNLAAT